MAPMRGWGQRGTRLIAHVPHGHWRTMTFVAALRCDRIDAPWVLNGPINANAFLTYVEKELVKTLSPNDIVVLDNLGSHKGQAVRQAIRRVGARIIFLPLQPRSQSHRATLLKDQAGHENRHGAIRRRRSQRSRPDHQGNPTIRMRQLHPERRVQVNLNAKCSRSCPLKMQTPQPA